MKFLVDECVGKTFVNILKENGFFAIYVGDALKGASDEEVLKFAEENKMILITEDKDFGKLVFLYKMPSSGVIIFRTSFTDARKRFELLRKVMKVIDISGKFIVITEKGAKWRSLI